MRHAAPPPPPPPPPTTLENAQPQPQPTVAELCAQAGITIVTTSPPSESPEHPFDLTCPPSSENQISRKRSCEETTPCEGEVKVSRKEEGEEEEEEEEEKEILAEMTLDVVNVEPPDHAVPDTVPEPVRGKSHLIS